MIQNILIGNFQTFFSSCSDLCFPRLGLRIPTTITSQRMFKKLCNNPASTTLARGGRLKGDHLDFLFGYKFEHKARGSWIFSGRTTKKTDFGTSLALASIK